MDVIRKLRSLREAIDDLWAGTFATAKACMLVLRHHRFVFCEIDPVCFKKFLLPVVEDFARQICIEGLNLVGKEDVQARAIVFAYTVDIASAGGEDLIGMHSTGVY